MGLAEAEAAALSGDQRGERLSGGRGEDAVCGDAGGDFGLETPASHEMIAVVDSF